MIETVGLLGSAIFEIKETWIGQDELWQANYVLKALPKGLKFFRTVSPTESPKVMGTHYTTSMGWLTALVWERGSKWGHCSQPPVDGALQAGSQMWEMLWLPVHHIRGYLLPCLEELPTLRKGRSRWVILISLTTSMKCTRSIFPEWDLDRGPKGGSSVSWATLVGIALLSAWP